MLDAFYTASKLLTTSVIVAYFVVVLWRLYGKRRDDTDPR